MTSDINLFTITSTQDLLCYVNSVSGVMLVVDSVVVAISRLVARSHDITGRLAGSEVQSHDIGQDRCRCGSNEINNHDMVRFLFERRLANRRIILYHLQVRFLTSSQPSRSSTLFPSSITYLYITICRSLHICRLPVFTKCSRDVFRRTYNYPYLFSPCKLPK